MINYEAKTQDKMKFHQENKRNKKYLFHPCQENIHNFQIAKLNKKHKYLTGTLIFLVFSLIASFLFFKEALIFVFIIGIILILSSLKTHLNSHQYHLLVDSKSLNGKHQCIFCGNKGIYRSTPYRTNITECRCSKCKEHLFNE